jgi:hypothetical protein
VDLFMRKRLAVVLVVVVTAVAVTVAVDLGSGSAALAAPGAKKLKAQLLCGVLEGGAITAPLPSKQKPRLDAPVACALHIDDAGGHADAPTMIATRRHVVDPLTRRITEVDGASVVGAADKDTEARFAPNAADADGVIAFRSCEDFDVIALVGDAAGTYFEKKIHIVQRCPRPRPIKASVACIADHDDGSTYRLPDRRRPRLSNLRSIRCTVSSKEPRLVAAGNVTKGVISFMQYEEGQGTLHESEIRTAAAPQAPSGDEPGTYRAEVTFPIGDWDECTELTLSLGVLDPAGASLFDKRVVLTQFCPD